ncbi:MAG TPA: sulfatase [Pirellulaceae bacterium]|nr:sulfatase [Pirellulaceae bacterium]
MNKTFWLTLLCGVLLSTAVRAADSTPAKRLNILVLCTDDQRVDTLGCTGNRQIQTPQIDALAKQGRVFDNSFVTTSICAISRASLFTGQYARRHGIANFAKPLSAEQLALSYPGLLRAAGYRTGFIGKWGVGNVLPKAEFDYWAGFGGQGRYFTPGNDEHLNRTMSRQALAFIEQQTEAQPFCLQVSFKAAHAQDGDKWEFPTEVPLRDLYADITIDKPKTATAEHHAALPEMLRNSESRNRWKPRFSSDEQFQKTTKDYYRLITGVDGVVGDIVKKLQENKLFDHTLIIFTSDNGYYLGDYGLADKWFMHEPSIRVPLVIFDPRLPPSARGQHEQNWALNIDIAPTILAAAGVKVPATMQGVDLLDSQRPQRREFYYEHPFKHAGIPFVEGVRGERWKYARYEQQLPMKPAVVVEQLFDLASDPLEEHDLAAQAEYQPQLQAAREKLELWRKDAQ